MKRLPTAKGKRLPGDGAKTSHWMERLLSSSPAVIFSLEQRGEKLVPTWISENIRDFCGYTVEEALSENWWEERVHPEDFPRVRNVVPTPADQGVITFEYQFRRKDGNYIWIQNQLRVILDAAGQVEMYAGSWTDITERKQSEIALRQSEDQLFAERRQSEMELRKREEMYRLLVESARAIPWEFDCEANQMSYVGPQIVEAFGYPLEEWFAPGFWEGRIHPEDRQKISEICDEGDSLPDHYQNEYRMLARDGRVVWVLDVVSITRQNGKAASLRGYILDITNRKNDEIKLRESEERFRLLTENCGQIFWLEDFATKSTLYLSPAFERIFGIRPPTSINDLQEWFQGIHPDDRERVVQELKALETGREAILNYRFVRPDGRTRIIKARSLPIRDASGKIYRQMGMAEDVTELRSLEEQLRQAQKMEAIGTLAGGIAHDFNNILGAIIGFAELTRMDSREPAVQENITQLLMATARATELVKQILAFSRKQKPIRSVCRIEAVLDEALNLLRATTPSTIEIRRSVEPNLASIFGDPTQLQQVIMNLAVNAIQAMDRGPGVLEMSLRTLAIDRENGNRLQLEPGEFVQLRVLDTGPGIHAGNLGRIFDPFFTTKAPGSGTGLGLSVVHGIVKAHKGTITVESAPGKGTVFDVYLPATKSPAPPEDQSSRSSPASGSGQRILFVDDESAIVSLTTKILTRAGFVTEGFTDPEAALAAFKQDPGRFDLVITDLTMPKLDGVALGKAIMASRPDLPILLASGFVPPEEASRIRNLGFADILSKPVDRRMLLEKIGAALFSSS